MIRWRDLPFGKQRVDTQLSHLARAQQLTPCGDESFTSLSRGEVVGIAEGHAVVP